MPSEIPDNQTRRQLLKKALVPPELLDICDSIFEMVLTEEYLLHEDAEPLSHPLTVIEHMMECALVELESGKFTMDEVLQAAVLSLLHDICSYTRITEEMIEEAPPGEKKALHEENRTRVVWHMEHGAEMAREVLNIFNGNNSEKKLSDTSIQTICSIIAIHDNPKIGIPIPKDNQMAVMFREADRLDMISPSGVMIDLMQKQKDNSALDPDDLAEQIVQVRSNLKRFMEERFLYDDEIDGPFFDDITFFRIPQAYAIYNRYISQWQKIASSLGESIR